MAIFHSETLSQAELPSQLPAQIKAFRPHAARDSGAG
jgi:hypothetical protein